MFRADDMPTDNVVNKFIPFNGTGTEAIIYKNLEVKRKPPNFKKV